MGKPFTKAAAIAAVGLFGLATLASANHLTAPSTVTCQLIGGVIKADWGDVEGATKYSVNVIASYDTGVVGDMTDDTTVDWDFGTGDRTDGAPASQSDLMIPLSALEYDFGTGKVPAVAAQLRVKGLHPGKNQGRQNNLFSELCTVAAPPAA